MTLTFAKDVPLDSVSTTLTAPNGSRADLIPAQGSSGTQIAVTLPSLAEGTWSLRWKLVSPDGHVVTDRISFTVTGSAVTTTSAQATAATTIPTTGPSGLSSAEGGSAEATPAVEEGDAEPFQTPGVVSWFVRFVAYAAFAVFVGGLTTSLHLWPARWFDPEAQRWMGRALIALAATAALSLLFATADIVGQPPWAVLDDVWRASEFGSVRGALGRLVHSGLFAVAIVPIARLQAGDATPPHPAVTALSVAAITATFSISGHAWSLGAPLFWVPVDMVHLGAAAVWFGSMIHLGPLAAKTHSADVSAWRDGVLRFSEVAKYCVAAVVATGVLQWIRTDGFGSALVSSAHGRLVVLKVLLLAGTLWAANINRQRINRRFHGASTVGPGMVGALRRAMATELAVGLAIVLLSAALVSTPPG